MRAAPQSGEPLNWSAYDLTLPADQATRALMARAFLGLDPDQIGDLSVATILETWVRDWRETLFPTEHLPEPYVTTLCRWLGDRLDVACDDHPAIDEFAAEMSQLTRTVATVSQVDHSRGEYVGTCPVLTRDETRCGTILRVDPYVDEIQCNRCGTKWNRRKGDWLRLRGQQLAAVPKAADVA
jgi:hypothetical protein